MSAEVLADAVAQRVNASEAKAGDWTPAQWARLVELTAAEAAHYGYDVAAP